ncbi:MAG TPA: tetratricopeptide repeat protein, partial [Bryobacteraceae bacterium]|nr:tetratricopeptide repeat protein [Bryobacteraceae bacterium]
MVRASVLAALVCVQVGCLKSPQSHLDRGNRLMAAGEYPGAEIEYRKSIQQAPRFAEAYYRLGLLDYQLQQGTEALENLQRARSLDPGNQRYSIDFASVAIEAFQVMPDKKYLYEQAVQEADSLLQKDPASFEGLRLRGDIAVIDRKYDAALADFEKADRIRPNDPNVVLATTQVLFALNKNDEGEALARRFLDVHREFAPMYDLMAEHYQNQNRPKDADRLLESEVAARPRDAHAWLQLAKLYRATGRTEEMTATLQRIAGDRAAFPEGALKVGDFYAGYAEWDKAVVEYRGGLDRAAGPAKLLYHRKLETAFEALGKRQEALAELHEILASNPQDASARLNRAVLLRQSQDAKEQESATQELKFLVSQYPNDAVVRYNLAMSYSSRGDQVSAAREAKASADLQKDYVAPRLLLAGLANGRHDAAAALEAAQQVLAIDPNNTAARLVRAVAWIDSKSYREAESDLRTIANQQPDSANVQEEVQLVSAQLAAAQNNYAQAEALYRRVYRPGSRDLRPLEGLIRLYNREHRPEQAQKLLEDAAKRDPQSAALYSALGGMYR